MTARTATKGGGAQQRQKGTGHYRARMTAPRPLAAPQVPESLAGPPGARREGGSADAPITLVVTPNSLCAAGKVLQLTSRSAAALRLSSCPLWGSLARKLAYGCHA